MFLEKLDKENLPKHIAITMDGNGRWAKTRGKYRVFGHQHGIKAVRNTVEAAAELGIKYLTLYAFSTENWNRPKLEVDALMSLLVSTIGKETKTLMDNNIKLSTIGNINDLPKKCQKELKESIEKTQNNTRTNLILALSYSSKCEIINAVKQIVKEGISVDDVDEKLFSQYLTTKDVPNPELLIRTSGEQRISNFLLWQIAYSEIFFEKKLWPSFNDKDYKRVLKKFKTIKRNYGNVL